MVIQLATERLQELLVMKEDLGSGPLTSNAFFGQGKIEHVVLKSRLHASMQNEKLIPLDKDIPLPSIYTQLPG